MMRHLLLAALILPACQAPPPPVAPPKPVVAPPLPPDKHVSEADIMFIGMRTNCPPFVLTAQFTECHAAAARAKRSMDTQAIADAIKVTLKTPAMFAPRSPEQCRTLVADRCAALLRP